MRKFCLKMFAACIALTFFVSGCSGHKEEKEESGRESQEEAAQAKGEPAVNYNPIGIDEYEHIPGKKAVNGPGDVFLNAYMSNKNKVGDKELTYIILDGIVGGNAVVEYGLMSKKDSESDAGDESADGGGYRDDGVGAYEENYNYEYHIALIDWKDYSVKEDRVIESEGGTVYTGDKYFCVVSNGDNGSAVAGYNSDFEEIFSFHAEGYTDLKFNDNGTKIYYCDNGKLMMYDVENHEQSEVRMADLYKVNLIMGVVSGSGGEDYVLMLAEAYTTAEYYVVIERSTGETKIILESDGSAGFSSGKYLAFDENNGEEYGGYVIADGAGNSYRFRHQGEYRYYQMSVLKDGRILFFGISETEVKLYLYEGKELIASTSFSVDIKGGGGPEYGGEVRVMGNPILNEKGEIILCITDDYLRTYYYTWIPQGKNEKEYYQVSDFDAGAVEGVDVNAAMDLSSYVPSELSENLLPLREKADSMESEYGIEIGIGQECKNVIGGYAIEALTDYGAVEAALNELDNQLKRYPDGFFRQFICDEWHKGVNIYLAGTLTGVAEGNLDTAGGFQNEYENYMIMVIDASDAGALKSTFHHEMSHSIEDRIFNQCITDADYCLADTVWEKLNPQDSKNGSCYTYDYSKFGYEENFPYSFENSNTNGDNIYFVDSYSMTYSTEDRARIFEEVMSGVYGVDFNECPKLRAKLNYYCDCIRKAFDTTGWNNVAWEAYK